MQISPVPRDPMVDKDGRLTKKGREFLEEMQRLFTIIPPMFRGTGDPNGTVQASPPALYFNNAGGAGVTVWVKESGTGTTSGWVAK